MHRLLQHHVTGAPLSTLELRAAAATAAAGVWNLAAWPLAWWVCAVAGLPGHWVIPVLVLPVLGIGLFGAALALVLDLRRLPLTDGQFEPLPLEPGYALRGSFHSALGFAAVRRFEVGLVCERRGCGLPGSWRCVWREERSAGAWPDSGGTYIQFGLRVPGTERLPERRRGEAERWRLVLRVRNLAEQGDDCEREFRLPVATRHVRPRAQLATG